MMTKNKLPDELLLEILLRLPVTSLTRFKLVCKFWQVLISGQYFIYKHLLHARSPSNKTKNALLLVNRRERSTSDFVATRLSYESLQVLCTQRLPLTYCTNQNQCPRVYIAGSCNGLVCVHDHYDMNIVLWNPATREAKLVPISERPYISIGYSSSIFNGIGFGFDARTRDYKIIRLMGSGIEGFEYTSEVYSLRSDSWRQIDSHYNCDVRDSCRGMSTDQNGIGSWSAKGDDWEGILSFDISNEAFFSTPQPDAVDENNNDITLLDIFLLNEMIAMAVSFRYGLFLDIWLLHEYGNKESWTKQRTVGLLRGSFRPLEFWKNDALFLETFYGRLVLFQPVTEKMTDLGIEGEMRTLQVINYMESLVSLKQRF